MFRTATGWRSWVPTVRIGSIVRPGPARRRGAASPPPGCPDGRDFSNIKYFVKSTEKQATSWEELPEDIRNTYARLPRP
jgi:hypothetical protein